MLALSLPFALGIAAVGLLAAQTAVQNPAGARAARAALGAC